MASRLPRPTGPFRLLSRPIAKAQILHHTSPAGIKSFPSRFSTECYLEALLSSAERKNGWQLAEQIGDARPWRTQAVLSQALWSQDKARALCRSYVVEHLGAPDGVLVVDETGFLKKSLPPT